MHFWGILISHLTQSLNNWEKTKFSYIFLISIIHLFSLFKKKDNCFMYSYRIQKKNNNNGEKRTNLIITYRFSKWNNIIIIYFNLLYEYIIFYCMWFFIKCVKLKIIKIIVTTIKQVFEMCINLTTEYNL